MVCDFVCILSVIAIKFLLLTSSEELSTKAAIAWSSYASPRFRARLDCIHYVSIYNRDMTIEQLDGKLKVSIG